MKTLTGYVLGKDNDKFYSIVRDEELDKSYQIDCEYTIANIKESDIKIEQKFNVLLLENSNMRFEFLNEYLDDDLDDDNIE